MSAVEKILVGITDLNGSITDTATRSESINKELQQQSLVDINTIETTRNKKTHVEHVSYDLRKKLIANYT